MPPKLPGSLAGQNSTILPRCVQFGKMSIRYQRSARTQTLMEDHPYIGWPIKRELIVRIGEAVWLPEVGADCAALEPRP